MIKPTKERIKSHLSVFAFVIAVGVLVVGKSVRAAKLNVGSSQTYTTIAAAISASSNGDTIIIHEGTYHEYDLKPKSGTTLKKADNEQSPIIDGQRDPCSQAPIFNLDNVNNVTFDGLTVTGAGIHFRGNWFIGYNGSCRNIIIKNCVSYLRGTCESADNPANIVLYDCDECTIRNTKIYGIDLSSGSNIPNGILIWAGSYRPVIENCEIYGFDAMGIYNKHGSPDQEIIVRNNYFHDLKVGLEINGDNSRIENNLIVNTKYGVRSYDDAGGPGGSNSIWTHNTLYNCRKGAMMPKWSNPGLKNVTFQNNLICFYGESGMAALNIDPYGSAYTHNFEVDHNLYFEPSTEKIVVEFGKGYNLSEWQARGYGNGSIRAEPKFVNSSGEMKEIGDFALRDDSPGKKAGSDGKDIGADVSLVGIQSGQDLTPPTRTNPQPTGTLSSGTTQTTISLTTDETATCKYSTTAETDYDSMENTFSSTNSTTHSQIITGLSDGNTYHYYIRCRDEQGNTNTDDYPITFSVAETSLQGDVTGDNIVDINDVQACVNHILGRQNWGSAADVNGDEEVNVLDVQEIVNIVLG